MEAGRPRPAHQIAGG